jgi:hypothetical protein
VASLLEFTASLQQSGPRTESLYFQATTHLIAPLHAPSPRSELEHQVGELASTSVACGVMGVGGNKGAVALSFSLMRRRIVVVSSHFAAHQVRSVWQWVRPQAYGALRGRGCVIMNVCKPRLSVQDHRSTHILQCLQHAAHAHWCCGRSIYIPFTPF